MFPLQNRPIAPYKLPKPQHNKKNLSETRKAIDHYSYALNEEIGRGFSSKVYRGRDENTSEPVAVKVIDMKMVKQSIHSVLLKNEIAALKAFNSRNIMKLHDVFQTQNNTYIITEYCDSGDLTNLLKRRGRLDENEAIRIISEVVSGLLEMNKKGFIHRDIKPANILMSENVPKIADLGFAVKVGAENRAAMSFNVGTPLYMSPQALRQQGHSEKGDVWAMGIVLFELIYGRPPFAAQSEAALISAIMHQNLHIPSSPTISDNTKDFIRKCLIVDEGRRMRVKDMAQHPLVQKTVEKNHQSNQNNQIAAERVPFREISVNLPPTKVERSQSQKLKELPVKIQRDQPDQLKRQNYRSNQEGPNNNNKQVLRSSSQQHVDDRRQARRAVSPFMREGNDYKQNNDILMGQINYCRYLYKFSHFLSNSNGALPQELRDKLVFLMASNLTLKIGKLTQLVDKENNQQGNYFQLAEIDNYRRTDAFMKFSQAIMEYAEKYMRYFNRILKTALDLTKDSLLVKLCSNQLNETDEYYQFISMYIKQALTELKNHFKKQSIPKIDLQSALPEEVRNDQFLIFFFYPQFQCPGFIMQGLFEYLQLINKTIESLGDYRTFTRNQNLEQLIERQPTNLTFCKLEQLMVSIN